MDPLTLNLLFPPMGSKSDCIISNGQPVQVWKVPSYAFAQGASFWAAGALCLGTGLASRGQHPLAPNPGAFGGEHSAPQRGGMVLRKAKQREEWLSCLKIFLGFSPPSFAQFKGNFPPRFS